MVHFFNRNYKLFCDNYKEHSSVQQHLGRTLDELYERNVPEAVREFIDSKAAAKPKRPPRPAPKPVPAPNKPNMNTEEARHER